MAESKVSKVTYSRYIIKKDLQLEYFTAMYEANIAFFNNDK